jgi:FAD/FMN-containing dehydrogenase
MTAPPTLRPLAGTALPAFPDFLGSARTDLRARAAYAEAAGIFRIIPDAVAVPSTTTALKELVVWAVRRRVPLVPRGAGSGIGGGNVGRGVVVDLTALDGCPIEVRPAAYRAYGGAGATLRDLTEEAGRHALRLPPDPSSARFATLGGIISTNAAGPRSVRAGSVRGWVEAIDLVTADGEALTLRRGASPRRCAAVDRFYRDAEPALLAARDTILARFPKVRKNSSGYALDAWLDSRDLVDLIVGAEGTLGLVTGAEWRLVPIPARYAGIRASLADIKSLGAIVPQLLEIDPSAVEYLDASFLRFVGQAEPGVAGLLMVELEGDDPDSLGDRLREARHILRPHSTALEEAGNRAALESLWEIRHAASPVLARQEGGRRSMQVIEDGCVPVESLGRYIEAVRAAGLRHDIEVVMFGHAGDGNLHVNLLPDVTASGWEERIAGIYAEVSEFILGVGGTLTGEHGDGRLRARSLGAVYGPEVLELFRRVKDAFDPVGILNPGVKIPAAEDRPFASLKMGAGAKPLPPDIEAGLRDIERFARFSVSRLDLADAPDAPDAAVSPLPAHLSPDG